MSDAAEPQQTPPTKPGPPTLNPNRNADSLESYNRAAETIGMMPSLRLKDNVIQGIIAVAGAGLGAIAGALIVPARSTITPGLGAVFGGAGGFIVFGILSGIVLMFVGWTLAAKSRR